MSLATTIGAGTLLGGLLAAGVYTALAPSDQVAASVPVAPTYAPVATPTVTEEAEDCVDPAVPEGDECVLHLPGPTVTMAAPESTSRTTTSESKTASRPASAPAGTTASYGNDDAYEQEGDHEDAYEHEDSEHEDSDYEDHGGDEHEDD